jgi:hypothetical protein
MVHPEAVVLVYLSAYIRMDTVENRVQESVQSVQTGVALTKASS